VLWFKMRTDILSEPVVTTVLARFGDEGFGRLTRLWILAARNSRPGTIGTIADAHERPCRVEEVAEALRLSDAQLRAFLQFLADRQHIDPRAWRRGRIVFPHMATIADEYTKKVARNRRDSAVSGQYPDSVRTVSGKKRRDRTEEKRSREPSARGHARLRARRPAGADRPAAGSPPPNNTSFRQVAAIARDVRLAAAPGDGEADLKSALKVVLVERRLHADPDTIRKALDATDPSARGRRPPPFNETARLAELREQGRRLLDDPRTKGHVP
jgi:hypothetical protein